MNRWILLLIVSPFIGCGVAAIVLGHNDMAWNDSAVMGLYVDAATEGNLLLGPYSRFEWHHPGPIYAYILAPSYALFQEAHLSVVVTALLGSATSLVIATRLLFGFTESTAQRCGITLIVLVLTCAAIKGFFARPEWNPVVAIMPLFLLHVCAVSCVLGRFRLLPLIVFLHAFTAQSHLGIAPAATVSFFFASVAVIMRSRQQPGVKRSLIFAGVLFLITWAPVIAAEIEHGNMGQILEFFGNNKIAHPPLSELLASGTQVIGEPFSSGFRRSGLATEFGSCLTAVLIGLIGFGLFLALKRRNRVATWFLLWSVVLLIVAVTSLLNIRGELHQYLIYPFLPAVALAWTGVVLSLIPKRECPPQKRRWVLGVTYGGCVALFLVGVIMAIRTHKNIDPTLTRKNHLVENAAEQIVRELGDSPLIVTGNHQAWGSLAALMLQIKKNGYAPRTRSSWRFMFANTVTYEDVEQNGAYIYTEAPKSDEGLRLLGREGELRVYLR